MVPPPPPNLGGRGLIHRDLPPNPGEAYQTNSHPSSYVLAGRPCSGPSRAGVQVTLATLPPGEGVKLGSSPGYPPRGPDFPTSQNSSKHLVRVSRKYTQKWL